MKKKVVLSVAVVLLVVMVAVMCVACTPSQKSVIDKFKGEEYLVVGGETAKVITATKVGRKIVITWFDNEDDAKEAYDAALKLGTKETVKRKGNAVAVGDADSIKIF
ncbi:MAG: hypothetical protein K2L70_05450 [Clostridia bacterium]|nr:hypothetical protein [Clostridia bacterium]